MTIFELPQVEALIRAALTEDVGRGDVTTRLTVPAGVRATGTVLAKQDGVLAGLALVARVFAVMGAREVRVEERAHDGDAFRTGTVLATVEGPAADLLVGERLALNLLQRLSGVATLTRRFVEAVAGTRARVIDTRKTTPGLRALEKYAVRLGGGHNHRGGLDDGILIKDNHITAAGGVAAALAAARRGAPHGLRIEIECATIAQVDEALAHGAEAILLDNMTPAQLAEAVRHVAGRALTEASGGVTLQSVRAIAETGVDLISVGALTHSAPAVDISMKIRL
jgi:nicotinate-nucleotide pyrophosphorylase (carboxylating)